MDKRIKKPIGHFFMFVIIIFLIAIIFITVGWAANKLLDNDKPLTLDDKKKRLKTVEDKIMELQAKKEEMKRKERQILLVSRFFIALTLLLANYFYMQHYKLPFDLKRSSNEMLRFNSMVLLVYSFIAFVSYGTPAKFVDSLKSLITSLLQKFSIDTYSQFEKLLNERAVLLTEIDIEEKQLKNNLLSNRPTVMSYQH
ncbi:hypothetical protein CNR22_23355 [Sphingobacteriaceae bacterium]|nr:hypothetical protein CNR22_23355 [Sphingobacteriaceae bacterium]